MLPYGQKTVILVNKTACPLNYQLVEVEAALYGCSIPSKDLRILPNIKHRPISKFV
ncbi:MAG: hypothetical protein ACFB10_25990 [Salibacteraceae bacterium]